VTGFRTLVRRIAGLLAAAMMCAMTFGPIVEAAECATEAPVAAEQTLSQDPEASAVVSGASHGYEAPTGDLGDGGLGTCQHGHCHHAAPFLPILSATLTKQATGDSPVLPLRNQHARSRAPAPLERPPRV